MTKQQIADHIKTAGNLRALHAALIEFEDAVTPDEDGSRDVEWELSRHGINISELPTFDGTMPDSTAEVWSWDADNVLCGVGPFSDWFIKERK